MPKVRTPEQMAEQMDFINAANKRQIEQQDSIWTITDTKRLDNYEILDRIELIEKQSAIIQWSLWWKLRQRFKSNGAWGAFLNEARENPHYANCVMTNQECYRRAMAGRFCERNKITDMSQLGIKKSVVYLLSQEKDQDMAAKLYRKIKKENTLIKDVKIMLEQEKAVATIEKQDPDLADLLDKMDYDQDPTPLRYIPVEDGVALDPIDQQEDEPVTKPSVILSPAMAEIAVNRTMESVIMDDDLLLQEKVPVAQYYRRNLIVELSEMDASYLNDDLIAGEIELLCKSYRKNFMQLNAILKSIMVKNSSEHFEKTRSAN